MARFADTLRRLREERGLTKTAMARELGITVPAYIFYEQGARKPKMENLHRIAEILAVSVKDLVDGFDDEDGVDDLEAAKQRWLAQGFHVKSIGDYILIEPSENESNELSPLELRQSDFVKLTTDMVSESSIANPDDEETTSKNFRLITRIVMNRRAALRRENPHSLIERLVPVEYLPK